MDKPPPICACCRERIYVAWRAWSPRGVITCAKLTCIGWARAAGWQEYSAGGIARPPLRPRGKPRCDYCARERPPLRDCFRNDDGQIFCSLTCRQAAARVGQ